MGQVSFSVFPVVNGDQRLNLAAHLQAFYGILRGLSLQLLLQKGRCLLEVVS